MCTTSTSESEIDGWTNQVTDEQSAWKYSTSYKTADGDVSWIHLDLDLTTEIGIRQKNNKKKIDVAINQAIIIIITIMETLKQ